jgi:putative cardiolipin synthase
MKSRFLFFMIISILLSGPAMAQMQCSDLFEAEAMPASYYEFIREASADAVNPHYLVTMNKWNRVWEKNILETLTYKTNFNLGSKNFDIESFHKSREFRSWFEVSNRMAMKDSEKLEPSLARVKLLVDPQQALATKLMAIREARHTIDMSYYILKYDEAGMAILAELKEAVRRGVTIRIALDTLGSGTFAGQSPLYSLIQYSKEHAGWTKNLQGLATFRKATVQIVNFNSPLWMPVNVMRGLGRQLQNMILKMIDSPLLESLGYSINRRSHDKILLIDGAFDERAIAFMGGRNVKKDYYDLNKNESKNVVDLEIMMRGVPRLDDTNSVSIGVQVQEYFDQVYFHLGNSLITRSLIGLVMGYGKTDVKMEADYESIKEKLNMNEAPDQLRESLLNEGLENHQVEVVNTFHNLFRDQVTRKREVSEHKLEVKNSRSLLAALDKHLKEEKEEIVLVSPYLWLSPKQIRLLKKWLLQDPKRKLTLVTNSILTNNSVLSQILIDGVLGPQLMLDKGIENRDGVVVRRSISKQVKLMEYGHTDSTALGGNNAYGLLHLKGILLKGSGKAILGTYNNDPRSMLLNSEGAAVLTGPIAKEVETKINEIIGNSHEYGSAEYHAIRSHPTLPLARRIVAEKIDLFHNLVIKLKLWWLI